MTAIAPHLRRTFNLVVEMLGIKGYRIDLKAMSKPNDDDQYAGYARTLQKAWRAEVEIQEDLQGMELLETIVHEGIHIALAPQDAAFHHHILELIPEEHRKRAEALYEDYSEESVERLARALSAFLRKRGIIRGEELRSKLQAQGPRRPKETDLPPEQRSQGEGPQQGRNGRWLSRRGSYKNKGSGENR